MQEREVKEESEERVANKHPVGFYWLIIHNRLYQLPIEPNNDAAFLVYFPKVPSEGSQTINGRRKGAKSWRESKFPPRDRDRELRIPLDFIACMETARAEIPCGTPNRTFPRVRDAVHRSQF